MQLILFDWFVLVQPQILQKMVNIRDECEHVSGEWRHSTESMTRTLNTLEISNKLCSFCNLYLKIPIEAY